MNDLVYYAMVGGVGWVGFTMAQQGTFGPTLQKAAADLKNGLRGAAPTIAVGAGGARVTLPSGAAPGPAAGGSTGAGATGCGNTDFVPGQRYVADVGGGQFETVLGGRRVFLGGKSEAEAYYRAHVCGG